MIALALVLATTLAAPAARASRSAHAAAPPRAALAARPETLAPAAADSIVGALLVDRADTEKWLAGGATSYLATVQRQDFGARPTLTVGRAADNDVHLDADSVADHHLRVTVVGDSFHVEAVDPVAGFRVKDRLLRDAVVPPSAVGVGRFSLRLSHQRFPAIIVFDPRSPRFQEYKGLQYFPPDLHYRYVAALTPNPAPDTIVIMSTRGNRRRAVRVGWFDFRVGGTSCRLEATRLLEPGVGEKDLSLFFRDATTGKESYAVGRYLDPEPLPDGRYVLDFNRCYNPACAVSIHYNCPIPTAANTLKVPIRAGEMDAHYLH